MTICIQPGWWPIARPSRNTPGWGQLEAAAQKGREAKTVPLNAWKVATHPETHQSWWEWNATFQLFPCSEWVPKKSENYRDKNNSEPWHGVFFLTCIGSTWRFPKMGGVPQNGWFRGTPYFRKPPYIAIPCWFLYLVITRAVKNGHISSVASNVAWQIFGQ